MEEKKTNNENIGKENSNGKIEEKKKSAMAVASLPLGIISIITNLFCYISLPTGILAIIFGAKTTRKLGSKLGKAGLITGIIGVAICAFIYIGLFSILILSSFYYYY